MRLILLLVTVSLCFAACGSEDGDPPAGKDFVFDSGGAHHIQGYGAWRVKVTQAGGFDVKHKVTDLIRSFEPVTLEDAEREALWTAIDAAGLAGITVEDRPGVPDENQLIFGLGQDEAEGVRVVVWQNDLSKYPQLGPILVQLRALIEKHCGVKPVF